jgi:hypothetical protein
VVSLLVKENKLTQSVADLVQEAYVAASDYIRHANAPSHPNNPPPRIYDIASASNLVKQARALEAAAAQGKVAPESSPKLGPPWSTTWRTSLWAKPI